jgi:hypothetical protein
MLVKFNGLPHLQVYRGDHILKGRAIKAGESVELGDEDAGYLVSEFPAGVFEISAGNAAVAKEAHKAAVAKKAALKAPPKSSAVE